MKDDTPAFVLSSRRQIIRTRGAAKWNDALGSYFVDGCCWDGSFNGWSELKKGWHLGPEILPAYDPARASSQNP